MSAVQHICNSFMWNILGKTKIIEKIWQSLITHESKKFPVSLGSELINVATQISMWPCKKILQINKRSPTFIRQTRVDTFKRVECYVHADGTNRLWIGWEFNFRCFLGLKFFLLVIDYQKLIKTVFWKFLLRLFFEFVCIYKFLWQIFLSISQFHESVTIKFFESNSLWPRGYVARTLGFHPDDPSSNPNGTFFAFYTIKLPLKTLTGFYWLM